MSPVIDKRVVQMGFDNAQFESGVQQTVKSLDTLKKGLDLKDSAKGFERISEASKNLNLQSIANGVQELTNRFSAFGIMGMTVLANLTNSAVNLAKNLASQYIIGPLKQGLAEYETQINAIQTVLANTQSKGTNLQQVNAALDELNAYADKTIYNFTEMTKNIGTFTAAGVDLNTSVAAIKGIANLAAVSGSNAQQASTAMYQLSQALASGTVKLMDWNSVVNAGMGGQVFQDALKETARVHKISIDDMIKSEGSFRETLQKGWLTSEILTETLSKFTGDLNAQQLKTMGYTEAQITEIIKLGKMANDAATKVKTFSQLKDTMMEAIQSGWGQTWRTIIGDFEEARTLFTGISDFLGGIIAKSSDARNSMLAAWKAGPDANDLMTSDLLEGAESRFSGATQGRDKYEKAIGGRDLLIRALTTAFKGLYSIMETVGAAFREIFPPMTGEQLYNLTLLLDTFSKKLVASAETLDKIKRVFRGVFAVFDIFRMILVEVGKALLDFFKNIFPPGSFSFLDDLANFADKLFMLRQGIKMFAKDGKAFAFAMDWIKYILEDTFGVSKESIETFLSTAKNVFANITSTIKRFYTTFSDIFGKVKGWLSNAFEKVDLSGIANLFDGIKVKVEPLKGLANIVSGAFNGILKVLKKIGPIFFKVSEFVGSIVSRLGEAIRSTMTGFNFQDIFTAVNSGLLGALILAFRGFMKDGSGVLKSASGFVDGIKGILDGVRGSIETWQQNIQAKTLMTIAMAIGILALSLIGLSLIDSKKLAGAIGAITMMFAELLGSMSVFSKISKGGDLAQTSAALVGMAAAILILAVSVAILASLDLKKLQQSLLAIGILLAEVAAFMKFTQTMDFGAGKSAGIIGLAIALLILTGAVAILAAIDPGGLQQSLTAMGAILAGLTAFIKANGDSKKVITTAIGLSILAGAMILLGTSVLIFSRMSWDEIGRGLTAMAGALLIMAGALRLMPKNMAVTGGGLLIVSAALIILASSLKSMGGMSWSEIAKGLATLAGSMLILAIAMKAMSGSLTGAAAILIVSFALSMLVPQLVSLGQMSLAEIGRGLLALAGVFIVLGVAGLVLGPLVPVLFGLAGAMFLFGIAAVAVGAGVLAFATGMTALAVSGTAGAVALVSIVTTILGLVPMLILTLVNAIVQFATLIAQSAPVIATALGTTLLVLIAVIVSVAPQLVSAIMVLITSLLTTIAANLPTILQAGMNIIIALLEGIKKNIGKIVEVAIDIVLEFLEAVAGKIPDVVQGAFDLILAFINGLTDGIDQNLPLIITAVGELAGAIIDGLVSGLAGGVGAIVDAVSELAANALAAFEDAMGINSPSKVFMTQAGYMTAGLVKGLNQNGSSVANAASALGDNAVNGMTDAVTRIGDFLSNDIDMNPTIRPVIDLTDVVSGGNKIDNLLGDRSFNVSGVAGRVPNVSIPNQLEYLQNLPNGQNGQSSSISFTQNNYSPEALSRLELYRQTRNQLAALKGLVGK